MSETNIKSKKYFNRISKISVSIITAAFLAVIGAWAVYVVGPKNAPKNESLNIELHRYMGDYPTELQLFAGTVGTLATYWEVTITNSGTKTDSIVKHEVLAYSEKMGVHSYTGVDQGLYDSNLLPLKLPLALENGHAVKFFIKSRTMVTEKPFSIIKKETSEGAIESIESIHRFLYRKGMDIHGLKVESSAEGVFSFPDIKKAPGLSISFTTVSGQTIRTSANWYPFQ